MKICVSCLKEMQCIHNGTKVRYSFNGSHVYAGDTFECPTCHNKIVVTNANSYHDNNVKIGSNDVIMNNITEIISRPKSINLRETITNPKYNDFSKIRINNTPSPGRN